MKRLLLILSLSVSALTALADDVSIGQFTYSLDASKRTATLTGVVGGGSYASLHDSLVVVPSTVTSGGTDYTVTALGDGAFQLQQAVQEFSLPETLTSIGEQCFINCSSMKKVNIPAGVKELKDYCFGNCI